MTIATLTADIECAQDEFRALNRQHLQWAAYADHRAPLAARLKYRRLRDEPEQRLSLLADRIAILYGFRLMLVAKAYYESQAQT